MCHTYMYNDLTIEMGLIKTLASQRPLKVYCEEKKAWGALWFFDLF